MLNFNFFSYLDLFDISSLNLVSLFIVSILAATILPIGSEVLLIGVIKNTPSYFWVSILVATFGNTIGGIISFKMGLYAKQIFAKEKQTIWFRGLKKNGPKTLLLAWLPIIGDSICILAGWLKYPFWQSVMYMAIGKFFRYLSIAIFASKTYSGLL